eukprot:Em0069g3a
MLALVLLNRSNSRPCSHYAPLSTRSPCAIPEGETASSSLGRVLSITAWDPAPVSKIALCPLVAPAKVETLAIFWPALWVARSVCTRWWSSTCWCGAEVMQLVHSCGLPKSLSCFKAAAIR